MIKQQKAFTLIETLVAMTLMSLLIMVLFGGFRAGVRSVQVSENHIESVEEPRQLSALLYRHLGKVVPVTLGGLSIIQDVAFLGTTERIRYVAPLAISVGDVYYLVEMTNGHDGQSGIWVRFAPLVTALQAEQILDSAQYMQISKDWSVHFSYFYSGEWYEDLPTGEYPELVSVRLTSADMQWPSMVFALNTLEPDE